MPKKHITINELGNIEVNYKNGVSALECSKSMKLGKDKIYRYYKEFSTGKTVMLIYENYISNKKKCGRKLIELSESYLKAINEKLDKDWSLDAISGRDKLDKIEERVCTSTLYRLAKKGIIDCKKLRRLGKRKKNGQIEKRGKNNTGKTIHERNEVYPLSSENIEYGHFEGDTIVGEKRQSAIVTLVEKATKCIVLLKASRKSDVVTNSINKWLEKIKLNPIKTITFDRGKEFSKWLEIEDKKEGLKVYFADAGSPGQRGLNENSNGIVRKDLPKSTDLSIYSQEELNEIANKWNNIPRKILNYLTPLEMLKKLTGLNTII